MKPNESHLNELYIIKDGNSYFDCSIKPKVTFMHELCVGDVKIPIKIELNFNGVPDSQHALALEVAKQIYL